VQWCSCFAETETKIGQIERVSCSGEAQASRHGPFVMTRLAVSHYQNGMHAQVNKRLDNTALRKAPGALTQQN